MQKNKREQTIFFVFLERNAENTRLQDVKTCRCTCTLQTQSRNPMSRDDCGKHKALIALNEAEKWDVLHSAPQIRNPSGCTLQQFSDERMFPTQGAVSVAAIDVPIASLVVFQSVICKTSIVPPQLTASQVIWILHRYLWFARLKHDQFNLENTFRLPVSLDPSSHIVGFTCHYVPIFMLLYSHYVFHF